MTPRTRPGFPGSGAALREPGPICPGRALTIAAEGGKAEYREADGRGSGLECSRLPCRSRAIEFRVVIAVQPPTKHLGAPRFPEEIDAGHQERQSTRSTLLKDRF